MNTIAKNPKQRQFEDTEGFFFCSSHLHWTVGTYLPKAIADIEKRNQGDRLYANGFGVWWLPGSVTDEFKIEAYSPQVKGKIWLGHFAHTPQRKKRR
tara:strand:+ start:9021 stop:9311 length:291 start_codon:yes stop_codon:yes gene_type:complete